jgi:hypothetical protein
LDNQQLQIPQEIRSFLENLLQDAGMTLDESMKEEMVKELYARLDNFVTATIVDNMPEDKIEEFIALNEQKKSLEEIQGFITTNLPNAQEVFAKAFTDFRNMYLSGVAVDRNVSSEEPGETQNVESTTESAAEQTTTQN